MWNTRGPIRISDKNLNRWSEQSFFDQTLMNFIQAPSAWKAVIENSERMVYSIRELFDCSFHRFSTFQTSQSSLSWYLKPWCILSSNKWNYLMPRQRKDFAAKKFNMGTLALLKEHWGISWIRLRRCIATINCWTDYCNNCEIIGVMILDVSKKCKIIDPNGLRK